LECLLGKKQKNIIVVLIGTSLTLTPEVGNIGSITATLLKQGLCRKAVEFLSLDMVFIHRQLRNVLKLVKNAVLSLPCLKTQGTINLKLFTLCRLG
jgi:hypothetical protein